MSLSTFANYVLRLHTKAIWPECSVVSSDFSCIIKIYYYPTYIYYDYTIIRLKLSLFMSILSQIVKFHLYENPTS